MNIYDRAQRRAELIGDRIAKLEASGGCSHGWLQGKEDGPQICKKCGKVFPSFREAAAEHARIARGQ